MTCERELPAPLVPPEVDLRGLEYMPLLGGRLFSSDFNAGASDSEWRAAVTLWWAAWGQVPAGSLPQDDVILCRLADLGRDVKSWRKLKARALHGFVLCTDGRYYHQVLCEQALIAWEKRCRERAKKAKWREKSALKDGGQDGGQQGGQDGPVHVDKGPPRPGQGGGQNGSGDGSGTADETRRDETGQELGRGTGDDVARTPGDPPEAAGLEPTPAGRVCRAMRLAGLAQVNPGDPRLLALLEQGATDAEFDGVARDAVAKGKGWAWALAALEGRRKDAAVITLPAVPQPAHERAAQTEYERTQAYLAQQRADPEAVKAAARLARERREAAVAEGQPTP